jgi:tetratricopeptide (TPR) repeat protein
MMQNAIRRYPSVFALLALAVLTSLAYSNALPNSFQFDDYEGIVNNTVLHELKNIPSYFIRPTLFRGSARIDWRPVLQATYALDYAIDEANPAVFRVTNILFHIGAAWLIFLIVAEMDRKRPLLSSTAVSVPSIWLCLIPAALFAVHTVNAETVNYIWARSSLLAAFFYLLGFYCYLRGPLSGLERSSRWWLAGGVAAMGLGMATKATAASLPAALVAYEFLFLNPAGRNPLSLYLKEPRRLLKYIPLAAILLGYTALRAWLLPRTMRQFVSTSWVGRMTYLRTQFRAWVYYIQHYVWPDGFILDYPGFGWSTSLWDVRVLVSLAIIAVILVVAWRARRTQPILSFFILWFFIALLPEASIVVRPDKVTGHRPYLSHVGLSVVAAVLLLQAAIWLWRKWKREHWRESGFRLAYAVAIVVVLCGLTGATWKRNLVWRDGLTLWTDALRKDPSNARGYMTLSMEYADREEYDKAQELMDRAAQLEPRNGRLFYYRGYLNMVLDKDDAALANFAVDLKIHPTQAITYVHVGDIYRKMGRYDDALRSYQIALRLNRRYPEAHFGVAMVHWEKKELDQATAACRKLNELNPRQRQGYTCLGSLLMHQEQFGEALRIYYKGALRFPDDATLWYGLGTAYEELGLYKEAQDAYAKSSTLLRRSAIEEKVKKTRPRRAD